MQNTQLKMAKMLKSDRTFFYVAGFASTILGAKVCDLLFYNEAELLKKREQMEDEYWQKNGEPKYIKPDMVESLLRPGEMRKTWIKITMSKDKYLTKEQYS